MAYFNYLCDMNAKGEAKIVYSTLYHLIGSDDFSDWVIHLICLDGEGWFVYDGRKFTFGRNDLVMVGRFARHLAHSSTVSCRQTISVSGVR